MATLEHLLEYTSAGIPVSLWPFFQEYRLEDLDPEGSAFTVIERTLGWGNIPDRILRSRPKGIARVLLQISIESPQLCVIMGLVTWSQSIRGDWGVAIQT